MMPVEISGYGHSAIRYSDLSIAQVDIAAKDSNELRDMALGQFALGNAWHFQKAQGDWMIKQESLDRQRAIVEATIDELRNRARRFDPQGAQARRSLARVHRRIRTFAGRGDLGTNLLVTAGHFGNAINAMQSFARSMSIFRFR